MNALFQPADPQQMLRMALAEARRQGHPRHIDIAAQSRASEAELVAAVRLKPLQFFDAQ